VRTNLSQVGRGLPWAGVWHSFGRVDLATGSKLCSIGRIVSGMEVFCLRYDPEDAATVQIRIGGLLRRDGTPWHERTRDGYFEIVSASHARHLDDDQGVREGIAVAGRGTHGMAAGPGTNVIFGLVPACTPVRMARSRA
jgi:hypothetical protein